MVLYKDEEKTITIDDRVHEFLSKGKPRSLRLGIEKYKRITELVDEMIDEDCIEISDDCFIQILNKIPIVEPHKYVGIQANDTDYDEKMFALTQFLDAIADYSYEEFDEDTCEKIVEFLVNEMEFNIYFKKVEIETYPEIYGVCLVIDENGESASVMAFGIANRDEFLFH